MRLEASLFGLQLAHVREVQYMDDVEVLGSYFSTISLAFETASGALLNRTGRRKSWDFFPGQAARTGLFLGYKLRPRSKCLDLKFTKRHCLCGGHLVKSSGRHQVYCAVLGWPSTTHPSPEGVGPRGLRGLQGLVLCTGHSSLRHCSHSPASSGS